jgi:hypothetical protein
VALQFLNDGLQRSSVNRNQGAESTLAYLWTQLHTDELPLTLPRDGIAAATTA